MPDRAGAPPTNGRPIAVHITKEIEVMRKKWLAMGPLAAVSAIAMFHSGPAAADPTPECNVGVGALSTECGVDAAATGAASVAVGNVATASNDKTTAVGEQSQASGLRSTAVGSEAAASATGANAFGWQARATNNFTLAAGHQALASGLNATAVGPFTQATGMGATALGNGSVATQAGTVALGVRSTANAANATAVGALATASGVGATAIGRAASATFDGSTAIGTGAATTAANQVALGGVGTSVRIGDIAASTAAQSGPVALATVDVNGTLGQNSTLIPAVTALQSASAAQASQLTSLLASSTLLGGRVDELFDLRLSDRRDAQQGIAAAVAMGQAAMPSAPGRTSFVLNAANFRGEQAVGGSILHRVRGDKPFAIGAGFSFAGNKNNALRVGLAGEF
jgi:autotransporter adhesin